MEAFGVKATADALENLIRDGRPEFKGDDGQIRVWTPHRPPRPEKSEGGVRFEIKSEYEPKGDQPTAIKELVEGIERNDRTQVLLGVTGSGKTYTMAKVIEATQRPALLLAPNKTLVALQYKRTQADFTRGTFRVRGDVIDIFPAHYEDRAWRVNLFGDTVENIEEFDPLTGHKQDDLEFIKIYANSHYVTPRPTLVQ